MQTASTMQSNSYEFSNCTHMRFHRNIVTKQYITTSLITSNFVFKIYICCFIISLYAEGDANAEGDAMGAIFRATDL